MSFFPSGVIAFQQVLLFTRSGRGGWKKCDNGSKNADISKKADMRENYPLLQDEYPPPLRTPGRIGLSEIKFHFQRFFKKNVLLKVFCLIKDNVECVTQC